MIIKLEIIFKSLYASYLKWENALDIIAESIESRLIQSESHNNSFVRCFFSLFLGFNDNFNTKQKCNSSQREIFFRKKMNQI